MYLWISSYIKYLKRPSKNLIDVFYERRNHGGNIYNESGVWRFRDLINFSAIDTEDLDQCARVLVSWMVQKEGYQDHIK